ncbi:phage tail protein I [Jeongeupia chitinilytica]|uniref:Phage tail protein I n=1 Tax=Jeongeupia chitinilytica TaxID=1041641 RepID=A0ABQ3H038_9NEIS|nr:phage tail protein I [Jeongeupia chitinilytica]GHD59850.1 hypothetical protein GCM10007350_11760 [Jeongeupia chitinilytica]
MIRSLLPPNRTWLEEALAVALAPDIDPSALRDLYSAERCPAPFLPWLAWARSVDRFDAAQTEAQQRALIASSIEVHRHKGTVAAVRQVFRDMGLGEIEIEEGRGGYLRDGRQRRDGFAMRGDGRTEWAVYRIKCFNLLSVAQAEEARQLLASIAPARSHLYGIDFSSAALVRNGYARRDGNYTRGSI